MAGLSEPLTVPTERDQFAALFEMRWRLFLRTMQRDEEKVSFVLWLIGRILVFGFSIGAGVLTAVMTYLLAARGKPFTSVFTFVFVGWQLLNLFRGSQPQGVEAELYRFPLRFRTYVLLWLSAGAFEAMTLLGTWICAGIFAGLALAKQGILLSGIVVLLFYALNLFLTRAVFVWLGRMLASRRARDLVLVVSSVFSILPQLLRSQSHHIAAWFRSLPLPPWFFRLLHWLPASLASSALVQTRWQDVAGLLAWTSLAAALFLAGLRRSFRGDDVHEFSAAGNPSRTLRRTRGPDRSGMLVTAVFGCEWARLRHGGSAIFSSLSPLLYVVLFGLRLSRGPLSYWIIPAAAAYIGLGLRWVNAFGQDGPGVQVYLLAPVPLRTVLMGKNLFAASLYTVQVVLSTLILCVAMRGIHLVAVLFTLLWMVFHMTAAFTIGNFRSISSPTFVSTEKVTLSMARRSRSSGGGWIALLLLVGSNGLGAAILFLCTWIHHPAYAPLMMLPFAVAGVLVYRGSLQKEEFRGDSIVATEPLLLRVARGT